MSQVSNWVKRYRREFYIPMYLHTNYNLQNCKMCYLCLQGMGWDGIFGVLNPTTIKKECMYVFKLLTSVWPEEEEEKLTEVSYLLTAAWSYFRSMHSIKCWKDESLKDTRPVSKSLKDTICITKLPHFIS